MVVESDRKGMRMEAAQWYEGGKQTLEQRVDVGDENLEIQNGSDLRKTPIDLQEKEIVTAEAADEEEEEKTR